MKQKNKDFFFKFETIAKNFFQIHLYGTVLDILYSKKIIPLPDLNQQQRKWILASPSFFQYIQLGLFVQCQS